MPRRRVSSERRNCYLFSGYCPVLPFTAPWPRILYQSLALHIATSAGVYHYHIFSRWKVSHIDGILSISNLAKGYYFPQSSFFDLAHKDRHVVHPDLVTGGHVRGLNSSINLALVRRIDAGRLGLCRRCAKKGGHAAAATLTKFQVPEPEQREVSGESPETRTAWRSGWDSNCRYRFVNNQTTTRYRGSRRPDELSGSPEAQSPGRLTNSRRRPSPRR